MTCMTDFVVIGKKENFKKKMLGVDVFLPSTNHFLM